MSREDNIDREARELWLTLRGEEAPKGLTGSDLLLILVAQAQEMRYDRYVSPHLPSDEPPPPPRMMEPAHEIPPEAYAPPPAEEPNPQPPPQPQIEE